MEQIAARPHSMNIHFFLRLVGCVFHFSMLYFRFEVYDVVEVVSQVAIPYVGHGTTQLGRCNSGRLK